MKKNKKPNFFIVGAPKCGTTALATYLGEHKDIFVSNPKEPHYFATDFPTYRCFKEKDEYLKLFDVENNEKAIGEASVFYMYSKEAIKNIYDFNPNAKLIVMIRKPSEMIYSLHSQLFYSTDEDIENFKIAWELEKERKNNNNIPKYCRETKLLFYSEVARYGDQLENIYQYFPQSQVKIVLFDDLKKDILTTYKGVLDFLNIEYDGRTEFIKINENKKVKSNAVNRIISHMPVVIINAIQIIKKMLGVEKLGILDKIREKNTSITKRTPLAVDLKKEIIDTYLEDINKVERILNQTLDSWKK